MREIINVFVCGITSYKYTHIGRLREKYVHINSVYR